MKFNENQLETLNIGVVVGGGLGIQISRKTKVTSL